jgi:peptidoglycan/LPS O-acetylase OafA/YrhL
VTDLLSSLFGRQNKQLPPLESRSKAAHPYFHHLDLIRIFCAIVVMSFHFCYNNAAAKYRILIHFTWFGWVGGRSLLRYFRLVIANSADGATAKSFLKGRMLRLYPSAWICATVTLIVIVLSGGTNLAPSYLHSMALSPKGPWISLV